jgi:hypothetical protein
MKQKTTWQSFYDLSPEAQKQVIDFIAFLQTRRSTVRTRKASPTSRLAKEAFIGMWRKRVDLQDSTAWVKQIRKAEWGKR